MFLFSADWELETRAQEWLPLGASLVSKLCDADHVSELLQGVLLGSHTAAVCSRLTGREGEPANHCEIIG